MGVAGLASMAVLALALAVYGYRRWTGQLHGYTLVVKQRDAAFNASGSAALAAGSL